MIETLNMEHVNRLIDIAVEEDLGGGDVTSELSVAANAAGKGKLTVRQNTVVCGMVLAETVLRRYGSGFKVTTLKSDGQRADAGDVIAEIEGPVRQMLSAERVLLNFIQRLCGISMQTRKFVDAVRPLPVQILDTRKTTPGWRCLEKYAVRCGGGINHRMGLYDAVMIKDNHLVWMGGDYRGKLCELVRAAKEIEAVRFIEVEVDRLEQFKEVISVDGVDVILLDNMSVEQMSEAAGKVKESGRKILLEASGNVTIDNVGKIAQSGVDRISVGCLTHSVVSADIGLDM